VAEGVVGAYVELIRNTPFIVQLFFVFFGLPALGVKLSPESASVLAMVINLGAYAPRSCAPASRRRRAARSRRRAAWR
jgi:His/Glu/Gln/Arg/opine family amino acid ABC transporter permease subunit